MSAFTRLPHKAAGKLRVADRFLAPNRGEPVVLMYHGVVDDGVPQDDEGAKHVRLSHFRDQLRLLERCRRVVPLTTLVERLLAREDCRGLVAITFDDGYLNNAGWAA